MQALLVAGPTNRAQPPRGWMVREIEAGRILNGEDQRLCMDAIQGTVNMGRADRVGRDALGGPQAIRGLGGRPRPDRLRHTAVGLGRQLLHQRRQAPVEPLITQIGGV